jgi:penicillin V acylase-like amidase (Ntn superfamily)
MEYKNGLLFGTNFDNSFRPGLLYVNKRGVSKSGWPLDEQETPATWTSKYGGVTIHTAPYQYAWAGMNEAGLVISTMQLDETRVPPPDNRPSLVSAAWVQYVLDTCTTVDDIIAAERQVRLNYGVDHYLACDATGQCLTVEFLEGKPVYHRGEVLPLKALMAGWPYARCFEQRRDGAAPGSAPSILAGRLARIDKMLRAYQPKDAKADVDYAFHILKEVSAPNTTWSLVFDLPRRTMFIRTYKNARVRHIDLTDLDFSCRAPVMMLDVHAEVAGDLVDHFQEYSPDVTMRHALQAIKFHKPDIPEETVRQMVQHLESFTCTDAGR